MKYKEFRKWCDARFFDGCWGKKTALYCVRICEIMSDIPFWKREKIWEKYYEKYIVDKIVEPINEKRRELGII